MTPIDRAAAEGFSRVPARTRSPDPITRPSLDGGCGRQLPGAGRVAVDLGAGTGKFIPRVLATGAAVVGIEPVPAMLAELRARHPEVDAHEGTAERIPLSDASVDAVLCAQSVHLVRERRGRGRDWACAAAWRRARTDWNVRDERVAWVAELTRIMAPYEGDVPRHRTLAWRRCFPAAGFGALQDKRMPHRHVGPPEVVIAERVLSVSFIAALPEDKNASGWRPGCTHWSRRPPSSRGRRTSRSPTRRRRTRAGSKRHDRHHVTLLGLPDPPYRLRTAHKSHGLVMRPSFSVRVAPLAFR